MPILNTDIFSHSKRGHKYASKGDKVEIIADMGNVLIVQDKNKNRFSIQKTNLL
jgi:hypothetical protein